MREMRARVQGYYGPETTHQVSRDLPFENDGIII